MPHRFSGFPSSGFTRWLRIAAMALVLPSFSLLSTVTAGAQTPEERSFERILEDEETGKLVLQFPVRRFERRGNAGPVITTHGMVHIADRVFYETHQNLLEPLDAVLFELVLPAGTGRPEYSLLDPESTDWKVAVTKMRLRTLATIANSYAMREGKIPSSVDELRRWDGGLRAFSDRLTKDGWGNDFVFSIRQSESDEGVDGDIDEELAGSSSPGNTRANILEITSWGEDLARGGIGPAADIALSQQESHSHGPMQASSMHRMAENLGLVHQGDVEKHDRPHWRSSDLSDDQVSERLVNQGMPNEEKKNADAWMPESVVETMSDLSQVIPGLKNAGKVFFLDMLAASPIAWIDSSSDPFAKVILDDRNQVVIDDLTSIIQREPNIRSVGIVYGAAHMPGIEAQLIEMGYEETKTDWIDAIKVSLPETETEREQLELSRRTIRSMGLLGGKETPGDGKRKRWRRSNTSEEALAQNYRKEMMRDWVAILARGLDADREAQREQAEKDLMALGTVAIPHLPASSDDDPDEFRIRLERIRNTLLERDKEVRSRPSRVTLRGSMTGREALEALAEQTGNSLPLDNVPGLDALIDIELEESLYWESLDEILDRLRLTVLPIDGDAMQIVPRNDLQPQRLVMASYSGSFRLEPVAISKAQRLYEPELSSTSMELALSWEPRLQPVFIRYDLEDLELKCDNGEVLRPKPDQGADFTPSGSQLVSIIEFDRPSRSAKEIVEWKGRFLCAIPGQPVAIRFKDLETARDEAASKGDLKVTFEKSRKNRDIYEILVAIALQGDQSTDSMQGWTSLIDAYLVDAQGNRTEHAGWSTTRITDRDVGVSFLFEIEEGLAGYEFVFVAPQSITRQSIEYSLGGVPLP